MPKNTIELKTWTGSFGRDYTHRNIISTDELEKLYKSQYGIGITELNKLFMGKMSCSMRVLEIGCNVGNQLICLQKMGFKNLYGIEPQDYAVKLAKKRARGINIVKGNIFEIPFEDRYFDLIFTAGVLIHINPKDIKKAMGEIHRCSKKYIRGYEYYSERYKEIAYRGERNLLWKANFPRLYTELFDDLRLIKEKRLRYLEGKNIDTMFLLEKIER